MCHDILGSTRTRRTRLRPWAGNGWLVYLSLFGYTPDRGLICRASRGRDRHVVRRTASRRRVTRKTLDYSCAFCSRCLGTRGVSALFGSGEEGVGQGDCLDDSGNFQCQLILRAPCEPDTLRTNKQLTKLPRLRRSLGHWLWQNDELDTGGSQRAFRQRRLELLFAPELLVYSILRSLGDKSHGLYMCVRFHLPSDHIWPIPNLSFVQHYVPRHPRHSCSGVRISDIPQGNRVFKNGASCSVPVRVSLLSPSPLCIVYARESS